MISKQTFPVTVTEYADGEPLVAKLDFLNKPADILNYQMRKSVNLFDDEYHALCERVLCDGVVSEDRTSVGTLSVFGAHLKFDLRKGFPLLTTKKLNFKHIINELLWLYSSKCYDLYALPEESQFLWKPWADGNGYLGPIYGVNLRSWYVKDGEYIDQIQQVIESIKANPYSRRHVVTAWNVGLLEDMSLVPCHAVVVQFYVRNGELSTQVYIRSNDVAVGACFNIAQYALLTHIIAQCTSLNVGDLNYVVGDAHIYSNHIDGIKEQLTRTSFPPPQLKINTDKKNFDDFVADDFEVVDYQHHPFIKFEVAV